MATSSTSSKKKGSIRIDLSWKTAGLVLGLILCAGFVFATVKRAERIEAEASGLASAFSSATEMMRVERRWIRKEVSSQNEYSAEMSAGASDANKKLGGRITALRNEMATMRKLIESTPDGTEEADKKLVNIEAEIKRVLGMVEASKKSLVAQANIAAQYATVINKQARAIDKLLTIHKISADEAIK